MSQPLVECVPNFAEGCDPAVIAALCHAIASVPGVTVLHRTSDADHNRTVITFTGTPESVVESALNAARVALDVLPFVPLAGLTLEQCVSLAHQTGQRLWSELGLPVYFYAAAALHPGREKLENVRRGEFEALRRTQDPARQPDLGGPALHPTAGAVIVGARKFLIAFNINLRTADLAIARQIARTIRTSNGGLPAVKALGVPLASRNLVQVSMNLTDFELTSIATVYAEVARLAAMHNVAIEESELIGMAPARALTPALAAQLNITNFHPSQLISN